MTQQTHDENQRHGPRRSPPNSRDLSGTRLPDLSWDSAQTNGSLETLYRDVESRVIEAIDWYLKDKRGQARWSRSLRALAILLASAGGLIPLVVSDGNPIDSRWGYVLLAMAASCVALDRLFGFSSAWMRYLTASMALQRLLTQLQFEWTALTAAPTASGSTADSTRHVLGRLQAYSLAVRDLVAEETAEWTTEFRTNLSQLERNIRTSTARDVDVSTGVGNGAPTTVVRPAAPQARRSDSHLTPDS
jgi:hypothetical protein